MILPAYQTSGVPTNKKPFIREGRKVIPWYHPDFPSINRAIVQIYRGTHKGYPGGPEGARTPDLIHAMDALSQLRYRPMRIDFSGMSSSIDWCNSLYAITGVPTSARRCSGTFGLGEINRAFTSCHFKRFTRAAHRRVRSDGVVVLQRPTTLCMRIDLLLLLTAFVRYGVYTIPYPFAICKVCIL